MDVVSTQPLVEPATVPEYFVNGIAYIEDVGGNLRFALYTLHHPAPGDGLERIVRLHVIMPTHAVSRAAMQASLAAAAADLERVH